MKVLDLQCTQRHVFEGWFASEADFLDQCVRGLVACPVCGDASIAKRLSAPRLNLGSSASAAESPHELVAGAGIGPELQAAWLALVRNIVANTDDVGYQFAEEARKIHYQETPQRSIRGVATRTEAEELHDEGIPVFSLPIPPQDRWN